MSERRTLRDDPSSDSRAKPAGTIPVVCDGHAFHPIDEGMHAMVEDVKKRELPDEFVIHPQAGLEHAVFLPKATKRDDNRTLVIAVPSPATVKVYGDLALVVDGRMRLMPDGSCTALEEGRTASFVAVRIPVDDDESHDVWAWALTELVDTAE